MKKSNDTGHELSRSILRFIRKHGLAGDGGTIVVGVSGGPDSVCLIHVLAGLREKLGIQLHIAHLDHTLRGAESEADASYVRQLAGRLGIEFTIEKRDVRAYRKEHGLTLEEAAREVRYAFFAEVARDTGAEKVAVGHTADDQVETVLMHLLRGTGLSGMAGMRPATPLSGGLIVIRPLLEVRRRDTESYCASFGLSPRTDSTNILPDQLRNRVRSHLIPCLKDYNPDIESALLRTAAAAGHDLDYVNQQLAAVLDGAISVKGEDLFINRKEFAKLHPALQRHMARSALERLLGDLQDIEYAHVESIVEAISRPAGKMLSLPRNLTFYGDYDHGLISTRGLSFYASPAIEGEYRLNVPGDTLLPGWKVKSSILKRSTLKCREGGLKACFDLNAVEQDLRVRARRRGDRFQPLGMDELKKLQDFMVDARIPRVERDRAPVVYSPKHIIWLVGHRIDERAKVTSRTRQILLVEFERLLTEKQG